MKKISPDVLDQANRILLLPCEGIVSIWQTFKVNPNGITQKRTIAVTDFRVYVMKTPFMSSKLELCKYYDLTQLKSLEKDPKTGVVATFQDGKIKIKDPEVEDQFIQALQKQICAMLKDEEFPIPMKRIAPISGIVRLEHELLVENKYDQALCTSFHSYAVNKPSVLKLSQFMSSIEIVLPFLGYISTITKVIVDITVSESRQQCLSEFFATTTTLNEIVFTEQIKIDLKPVFQNCKSQVKKVTFANLSDSKFVAKAILAVLQAFYVDTLIIDKSVNADSCQEILNAKTKFDPANVVLMHQTNDLLLALTEGFQATKKFTIDSSEDDVCDFLNKFSTNSIQLDTLEIQNCNMASQFDMHTISKILQTISIHDCTANEESMKFIYKAAQNSTYNIQRIKLVEGSDEKRVAQSFKESCSIHTTFFAVDDVFMNDEMLNCLQSLSQLDEIHLLNVLTKDHPEYVDIICTFIQNTPMLRQLDISIGYQSLPHASRSPSSNFSRSSSVGAFQSGNSSSPQEYKGVDDASLEKIFNALSVNKTVDTLYLNGYILNENTFSLLAKLLNEHKIIRQISIYFDSCDQSLFSNFLNKLSERNEPITILWNGKDKRESNFSQDVLDTWKQIEKARKVKKLPF